MLLDALAIREEETEQDVSGDAHQGAISTVDFLNNPIVQQEVDHDYTRLQSFLNPLVRGRNTSNRKIDEFYNEYAKLYTECTQGKLPSIHSYHPISVIKAAMDYGFMIDYCLGPILQDPSLCSKKRANGVWVALPEELEKKINIYFTSHKPSSGFCPDCFEVYSSNERKRLEKADKEVVL